MVGALTDGGQVNVSVMLLLTVKRPGGYLESKLQLQMCGALLHISA